MSVTWWVVVLTPVLWIAWDIFADWKWGDKATESVLIDKWVTKFKPLLFLLGFLCGHLFWQVHICTP